MTSFVVAVTRYQVIEFVHITAVVVAFGVTFAFPIIERAVGVGEPLARERFQRMMLRLLLGIVLPAMTVIVLTGVYLTWDASMQLDTAWLIVPVAVVAALFALTFAVFIPGRRRLVALCEQGVEIGPGQAPSAERAEYRRLSLRLASAGALSGLLIVAALFFMVAKPVL